jgi:hypothetical protein
MNKPTIYFFVKTFENSSYAEQFLGGTLFMKSLDYFVKLEDHDHTGRGDRHEGISAWLQPNEIQIEINGIQIKGTDTAAPVICRFNENLTKNIFCIHAAYLDGKSSSKFETLEELEQALKIPQENIALGMYSVIITNVELFIQRIKVAAARENVSLTGRLVNYYEPASFHGQFSAEDAPFYKQVRFSHQREYRLVVTRSENDNADYSLKIVEGLRDIAHVISIDDLNQSIKIFQK